MYNRKGTILAIIGSLLIHITLLVALTIKAPKPPPPPPPPPKQEIKEHRMKVTLMPLIPAKAAGVPKPGDAGYVRDEKICAGKDNKYLGVGIIIQPGSDRIISAPPQYPAYRAGLREGDLLIDPFVSEITADGYLDFIASRNNIPIKFHIKTENICFKKEK